MLDIFEDVWEKKLNWTRIEREHNETGFLTWLTIREMQDILTPYLLAERSPIRVSKRPKPLVLNCSDVQFSMLLTGKPRTGYIPKLIDVNPFGFDVDILEMRLFELAEAVDLFVPLESTFTHRGLRKALFIELSRARFLPFRNRILHCE